MGVPWYQARPEEFTELIKAREVLHSFARSFIRSFVHSLDSKERRFTCGVRARGVCTGARASMLRTIRTRAVRGQTLACADERRL